MVTIQLQGNGMERTYLIQRLKKPHASEGKLTNLVDSFAFGGGYKNGGLTAEAMKLLRPIFRFDYMGSAEFEWGEVPRALSGIYEYCKAGNCVIGNFKILEQNVYYLCRKDWEKEVVRRIKILGENEWGVWLKESDYLKRSLTEKDTSGRTLGWLELDNGFMFFIDKNMFDKVSQLFGIKQREKAVKS